MSNTVNFNLIWVGNDISPDRLSEAMALAAAVGNKGRVRIFTDNVAGAKAALAVLAGGEIEGLKIDTLPVENLFEPQSALEGEGDPPQGLLNNEVLKIINYLQSEHAKPKGILGARIDMLKFVANYTQGGVTLDFDMANELSKKEYAGLLSELLNVCAEKSGGVLFGGHVLYRVYDTEQEPDKVDDNCVPDIMTAQIGRKESLQLLKLIIKKSFAVNMGRRPLDSVCESYGNFAGEWQKVFGKVPYLAQVSEKIEGIQAAKKIFYEDAVKTFVLEFTGSVLHQVFSDSTQGLKDKRAMAKFISDHSLDRRLGGEVPRVEYKSTWVVNSKEKGPDTGSSRQAPATIESPAENASNVRDKSSNAPGK